MTAALSGRSATIGDAVCPPKSLGAGNDTRVDIIVPTHARPNELCDALDSVRAQTEMRWHCWIVHDGSGGETELVAQSFLSDCRFSYLPAEWSGRPAVPRNRGIRAGSAPFVAFLDDDDYWLPDKLAIQLAFLEDHSNCVLLGSNAFKWRGGAIVRDSLGRYFEYTKDDEISIQDLVLDNGIINSSAVVRREALRHAGVFNESPRLRAYEDYELWLRLASVGQVWRLGEPLVAYRLNSQQSIRFGENKYKQHLKALEDVFEFALLGDGFTPSPVSVPGKHQLTKLYRRRRRYYWRERKLGLLLRCVRGAESRARRMYRRLIGK